MAIPTADKERILAKFRERVPSIAVCSICGHGNWSLADGFTMLPVQDVGTGVVIGGPIMPCIGITCANCGNTVLLNLLVLGLKDILEKKLGS